MNAGSLVASIKHVQVVRSICPDNGAVMVVRAGTLGQSYRGGEFFCAQIVRRQHRVRATFLIGRSSCIPVEHDEHSTAQQHRLRPLSCVVEHLELSTLSKLGVLGRFCFCVVAATKTKSLLNVCLFSSVDK